MRNLRIDEMDGESNFAEVSTFSNAYFFLFRQKSAKSVKLLSVLFRNLCTHAFDNKALKILKNHWTPPRLLCGDL